MFKMIANGISVDMFVGICDFEYLNKQTVVVNVIAWGKPPFQASSIEDCLDYSKVCSFVHSWANREHVELIETLLQELIDFVFEDPRIQKVDIEVLKPDVIKHTNHVGVGACISREDFENKTY